MSCPPAAISMSWGTAAVSWARPIWSIIMGTTRGWASASTAEKTKAALCAEATLAGRASSLTARSCRFHSQLATARAKPRRRRSASAAARSLLAARFVQASLEQIQNRNSDGAHKTGHGREKLCGAGFREQQSQAIEKAVGIAMQKAGENGIESA